MRSSSTSPSVGVFPSAVAGAARVAAAAASRSSRRLTQAPPGRRWEAGRSSARARARTGPRRRRRRARRRDRDRGGKRRPPARMRRARAPPRHTRAWARTARCRRAPWLPPPPASPRAHARVGRRRRPRRWSPSAARRARPGARRPARRADRTRPRAAHPRPAGRVYSPPDGRVQVFELVDRRRVEAGREVLPAVVADDEDDVALVELVRDPDRDACDRAGADTREDALLVKQLLRPYDRVAVGDEDLPVEQAEVDDRRDEAVIEAAQALHGL